MKNIYLFLFSILSVTLPAQTYYWVGGSGNWSDISHWATSSGGNQYHNQVPTETNNVIFDQNSFAIANQTVNFDMAEAFCNDFNTLAVTNTPAFQGDYYLDQISIYGDFKLSSNAQYDLKSLHMLKPAGDSYITSGSVYLGGLCFLKLDGGANYHLEDSISVANIYVYNAKFFSENNPIHCSARFRSNYFLGREIHFGSSHVYTPEFVVTNDLILEADNSTIHLDNQSMVFGDFDGAGLSFGDVIFSGNATIIGSNSFNSFSVLSGTEMEFEAGSTQTAQNFVFIGTPIESVNLGSTIIGTQANISQSTGIVNGNYLVLQDMNATGGATFNANNTADLGNNTGWNIIVDVPADYYWVGGEGNWDDLNHWATTSDGNQFHSNLPNALDEVIIDQNSFDVPSELNINVEATCAEFRMENTIEGIEINGMEAFHCYGSMNLSNGTIGNFYLIYPEGNGTGNTISTNNATWGDGSVFIFNSVGEWQLTDSLRAGRLEFNDGVFRSNAFPISLNDQITTGGVAAPELDLTGSSLYMHYWRPLNSQADYILNAAVFYCSNGDFYGNGLNYDTVILGGSYFAIESDFSTNVLSVEPGCALTMEAGITVTVDFLELNGTQAEPISILSSEPGQQAYFQQASGEVNGYYLTLTDNHAIGGADFIAHQSTFNSNVEGWQLQNGMEEINANIQMYPNPATDAVRLDLMQGEQFEFYDAHARLVLRTEIANYGSNEVSIEHLTPGLYFVVSTLIPNRNSRLIVY